MLRVYARCFVLSVALFGAAYGLRLLLVPDVVAIADRPQMAWRVELAFVLTTVQNLGAGAAALTLALALGMVAWRWLPPRAAS